MYPVQNKKQSANVSYSAYFWPRVLALQSYNAVVERRLWHFTYCAAVMEGGHQPFKIGGIWCKSVVQLLLCLLGLTFNGFTAHVQAIVLSLACSPSALGLKAPAVCTVISLPVFSSLQCLIQKALPPFSQQQRFCVPFGGTFEKLTWQI